MSLGTILIIILIIVLLGGFSGWGGGPFYGRGPYLGGGLGLVLLILIILRSPDDCDISTAMPWRKNQRQTQATRRIRTAWFK